MLTEPTFFDGSLDHLAQVRAAVDVPLLRKDFIVTEYQLVEAVAYGADAVLLIVGALDDGELRTLLAASASSLGLAALVEVHDRSELERAFDADADIVGVNSRNLRTLTVDPGVLEQLGARDSKRHDGCGGERHPHARRHRPPVAPPVTRAFLVGERLITEPDPGPRCGHCERQSGTAGGVTRDRMLKICGIRRLEDALLAAELGAGALGFVFWPASPRFLDPYAARPIVAALPPLVTTVGVFVDAPETYVSGVARLLNLGAVQLHGQERVEPYARASYRVIKAVAVTDGGDCLAAVKAVPARATVLLDAHDPVRRGGTGRTIDWTQAAAAAKARPIILSGGLNADNVRAAIDAVRPYAVDVSSGVESSPGVKDPGKLRALFGALSQHQAETI